MLGDWQRQWESQWENGKVKKRTADKDPPTILSTGKALQRHKGLTKAHVTVSGIVLQLADDDSTSILSLRKEKSKIQDSKCQNPGTAVREAHDDHIRSCDLVVVSEVLLC
jgi:hypothetical protein